MPTAEQQRIAEMTGAKDYSQWRAWGAYVADRAWATVREDYSANGDAWSYLPHELARSKAYRWGEDGIAAWCDRYQFLLFAPTFWNGQDRILKERLFGVTPHEGNHGEDVKEYYFHLDATPTGSYMKFLYKYPQRAFPYEELVRENRNRRGEGPEYELLDTGVFDENRYFDIEIEYAKAGPDDLCMRIKAINRGPVAAPLHILPTLWFRNLWRWPKTPLSQPTIYDGPFGPGHMSLLADDTSLPYPTNIPGEYRLGPRCLYAPAGGRAVYTNNETHAAVVYGPGHEEPSPYAKDAFHRWLIQGEEECINPDQVGTKAAIHYRFLVQPKGGYVLLDLRLTDTMRMAFPLRDVADVIKLRRAEADEFYQAIAPPDASEEERRIQRQAFAGLCWTKQSYLFDVQLWREGDRDDCPPPPERKQIRNVHWQHLNSMRILTVPDKWEYPWFAAWDLAFHCVSFALIDPQYAKDQLWVMLFEQFQHPNGQIPAYEWEFSDLNPPVHAWAVWRVYNMEKKSTGRGDRAFLERCFHKLLINFAWWINKVDSSGNNVFEGGFLGLDNISVIERSEPFRDGSHLEQADATGWMGMFCLNLMRIAMELAQENRVYEGLATKFVQHYFYVASAMKRAGGQRYNLWSDRDGFFYDVLVRPNGRYERFRVRSLVGLIPLFAVERIEERWLEDFPEFRGNLRWFMANRKDLCEDVVHEIQDGDETTYLLTIMNPAQLGRMMDYLFDPNEFLSDHGMRSLSKCHQEHPFTFEGSTVGYEPAEAVSKIKGGNSNWRGPIWFPTTFLMIESLRKLGAVRNFRVERNGYPHGKGPIDFHAKAREMADRMIGIFTRNKEGRRPVFGNCARFQEDPHWRDLPLFYEYFHADSGAGLGASHQTGWTALVANLIQEWRSEMGGNPLPPGEEKDEG